MKLNSKKCWNESNNKRKSRMSDDVATRAIYISVLVLVSRQSNCAIHSPHSTAIWKCIKGGQITFMFRPNEIPCEIKYSIFNDAAHANAHSTFIFPFVFRLYANKSQLIFPCAFMPTFALLCSLLCQLSVHIPNSFRCHIFPSTIGSWEICRAICCQCKRKIYVSFTALIGVFAKARDQPTKRPTEAHIANIITFTCFISFHKSQPISL